MSNSGHFRPPPLKRYGLAVASVLAAVAITYALRPLLHGRSPLAPFTVAVIVSAWYGGLSSGILCAATSIAVVQFLFSASIFSLVPVAPGYASLTLFSFVSLAVSLVAENLLEAAAKLSEARDRLQKANEELQHRHLELETTREALPEILFTTGADGGTDYCSRRFYDYTGMAPGSGAGSGWLDAVHPEDREPTWSRWLECGHQGCAFEHEFRLRRFDGVYRWHRSHAVPMRDAGGKVIKWVGVASDVDEHKRLGQQLAAQTEALSASNADLQQFAFAASHDLQEPLRMIASYSQLLARRNANQFDEDSKIFISHVLNSVDRMQTLIRDLLEFASATREIAPAEHPTDANAILLLALQHLRLKVAETGARVTSDPLPMVMANDSRLLQVFQNLISNALKYNKQTPEIHISARKDGETVVFSVKDNGIGIDPQYHERIFGLFQRLHSRNEYAGTGIGLSVVKRIVEQHGGRVWVQSEEGRGSTFFFTLPSAGEVAFAGQGT
jgi:PAS domain S-box-containing protein